MNKLNLHGRVPVLIIIIILLLTGVGIFRRCSESASTLANDFRRPGKDTLSVAIEMSRLTYSLHNDTAEGFDYSILRQYAADNGKAVVFHPVSELEPAFSGLDKGLYDIVVASFPSTNVLKEYFGVTDPVYLDRQVLVQRRGENDSLPAIESQEKLIGDSIWVVNGSSVQTRLRNMAHELGDTIYVTSPEGYSQEQLGIATALGEIRHAVISEAVGKKLVEQYPALDISTPISFNQFQCWAVAKNDTTLLKSLNTWLDDFESTPRYRQLTEEYLP